MSGSILSSSLSSCYNLKYFYCHQNSLTGSIPDLSTCYSLEEFDCRDNKISGSISILSNSVNLRYFNCKNNRISGSLPNLDYNTALNTFICNNNNFTGSIPSLASASVLVDFECASNKLNNYISGSVASTLVYFTAENNLLPQPSVDGLLQDFDNAGGLNGYLNLSGSGNSTPSSDAQKTYLNNLINKGWVVYIN
jgi:Leucine-rich repeat (LRR) protein